MKRKIALICFSILIVCFTIILCQKYQSICYAIDDLGLDSINPVSQYEFYTENRLLLSYVYSKHSAFKAEYPTFDEYLVSTYLLWDEPARAQSFFYKIRGQYYTNVQVVSDGIKIALLEHNMGLFEKLKPDAFDICPQLCVYTDYYIHHKYLEALKYIESIVAKHQELNGWNYYEQCRYYAQLIMLLPPEVLHEVDRSLLSDSAKSILGIKGDRSVVVDIASNAENLLQPAKTKKDLSNIVNGITYADMIAGEFVRIANDVSLALFRLGETEFACRILGYADSLCITSQHATYLPSIRQARRSAIQKSKEKYCGGSWESRDQP